MSKRIFFVSMQSRAFYMATDVLHAVAGHMNCPTQHYCGTLNIVMYLIRHSDCVVEIPQQKSLSEGATILRYTYPVSFKSDEC